MSSKLAAVALVAAMVISAVSRPVAAPNDNHCVNARQHCGAGTLARCCCGQDEEGSTPVIVEGRVQFAPDWSATKTLLVVSHLTLSISPAAVRPAPLDLSARYVRLLI